MSSQGRASIHSFANIYSVGRWGQSKLNLHGLSLGKIGCIVAKFDKIVLEAALRWKMKTHFL